MSEPHKAPSLIKSSVVIGLCTLASRILGFVRDIIIAKYLGASWMSDAFFVAFKIPNFLRRLFAEGAFNAGFVPMFAGMLATESSEKARAFASEAMSLLVTILCLLTVICILAMPVLMLGLAPGFVDDAAKFDLSVTLTQITFPYIIFISIVCLLGGILNSYNRFAAVAASPIILNICLITIPFMLDGLVPTFAHGLAWAVFAGGVLQALWLGIWCKRLGIMPRLKYPTMSAEVRKLFRLMAPAAMGAGVAQINLLIDLIIASHIASGVSYLYFADRINQLPLGVIGIAMGTALLPLLSKQLRSGQIAAAQHSQNRGMEFALMLSLPAAAALMILAQPIIELLYQRGEFTAADTAATYPALIAFAAGLPAFILIKVLVPAFYANENTKTPFIIASICVGLNLVLNLALIGPLAHVGMAVATTTAAWVNVFLLSHKLEKQNLLKVDSQLARRLPRILLCSAIMGAALLVGDYVLLTSKSPSLKIISFVALCIIGMVIYAAALFSTKTISMAELKGYVRKK